MSETINLDRSFKLDISYPIGVTEKMKFTNTDVVTLTDSYEIVIADQNGLEFETIPDDGVKLTKTDNYLEWVVDYEHSEIDIRTYNYELRNLTQDWIEFRGTFKVTKTLK